MKLISGNSATKHPAHGLLVWLQMLGLRKWGPGAGMMTLPFNAYRSGYATAVQAGLLPCSLLDSARMEQRLAAAESLLLGPLARRV